jgi:peptide/nickel transport system permease protein
MDGSHAVESSTGGASRASRRAGLLWSGFWRSRRAGAGLAILGLCVLGSALAPLIAPNDPNAQHADAILKGPSTHFLLGTDEIGRDILSRLIFAGRDLLYVGFGSVLLGAAVGTLLGVVSGYRGGAIDALMMRLSDLALGFPAIIIGVMVAAIRGPGATNLLLAIAIYNTPVFVRLARTLTLRILVQGYVEVARAGGARQMSIIRRHILPNIAAVIIVQIGVAIPTAILLEAGLAFLGLGARLPAPTVGGMLGEARPYLTVTPWFAIAPGIALVVVVTGLNLLADGLRDLLDPRWSRAVRET